MAELPDIIPGALSIMAATIDTTRAHMLRQHGDITAVYTWVTHSFSRATGPCHRVFWHTHCLFRHSSVQNYRTGRMRGQKTTKT